MGTDVGGASAVSGVNVPSIPGSGMAVGADLSDGALGARLKGAGLRSTAPRRAVIRVLMQGGHWSASEVFEVVSRELEGTSLQAVYGILSALGEADVLRKIELPGSAALYEIRAHDNHHHLLCTQCGAIRDVPCAVGAAPCLTASDPHGFAIEAADVTFRGICPDCQGTNADRAAARNLEPATLTSAS